MIRSVNLTKRYDNGLLALDALNLEVEAGEIYCLLGANGAGKTTAINLLLNFIKPTSGHAYINGLDVSLQPLAAREYVAYIPENATFYGNYTARQNLDFFAKLAGIRTLGKEDYYDLLRDAGIEERAFEQPLRKLSKGTRQRVGIAILIMRNAPVVLLDEPISGLDRRAAVELMGILDRLRANGKAILMSTNDIFRLKDFVDRVAIMREGRKILERSRDEIENEDLQALYLDYLPTSY